MPTRAEHRTATLRRLSDAAVEMFEQHGAAVTVEEIAAEAGVSRRTVFRYIDAKADLAFIHPRLWFAVFDEGVERAGDLPLVDRLRLGSRAIALHIDADPEPVRRAFLVAASSPELQRGFSIFRRWVDRVADEVLAAAAEPSDPEVVFRSRIVGAAVMGMVDAVTRQWLFSEPEITFVSLYDQGFEMLAPLFEE